jgi:Domain of unknown function (DUF1737)
MKVLVSYTVATEDLPSTLSMAVNALIQDGWRPLGGVSLSTYRGRDGELFVAYAQAMTLETLVVE